MREALREALRKGLSKGLSKALREGLSEALREALAIRTLQLKYLDVSFFLYRLWQTYYLY